MVTLSPPGDAVILSGGAAGAKDRTTVRAIDADEKHIGNACTIRMQRDLTMSPSSFGSLFQNI
jgi:hypothetical protein